MKTFLVSVLLISFSSFATEKLPRADLNGDKKVEKLEIKQTKDNHILTITDGVEIKKEWKLEFIIGNNSQGSFCSEKIIISTEDPGLPIEEWGCDSESIDEKCKEYADINKEIIALAKKGMKGLILDDGECDAFHVYWNGKKKQFDSWRM